MKNIIIYSKNNCNYCVRAKSILHIKNLEYKEFVLDKDYTKEELLKKFPGAKTLPQIEIDGVAIGGYRELDQYLKTI